MDNYLDHIKDGHRILDRDDLTGLTSVLMDPCSLLLVYQI